MKKIAHIINPVVVNNSSDLYIAQPVTFETIRIARRNAYDIVNIELFTAQYPEDHKIIPEYFTPTPDLKRSVLDIKNFHKKRKLPLIKDILDRLYEATDADYLIYTNVDIALMPHFYLAVNTIIDAGYDAFVINRRTISNIYKHISELPLMYSEIGKPHPGWDCFIFRRDIYPKFKLGNVCIGATKVGLILLCNLLAFANRFKEFKNKHLTFHIGEECVWQKKENNEYTIYNEQEVLRLLQLYKKEFKIFDPTSPVGVFLEEFSEKRDTAFVAKLFNRSTT